MRLILQLILFTCLGLLNPRGGSFITGSETFRISSSGRNVDRVAEVDDVRNTYYFQFRRKWPDAFQESLRRDGVVDERPFEVIRVLSWLDEDSWTDLCKEWTLYEMFTPSRSKWRCLILLIARNYNLENMYIVDTYVTFKLIFYSLVGGLIF